MLRELSEEVEINGDFNVKVLGYINDDKDSVGRVHFGILYLIETDSEEVFPKGNEMAQGSFKSLEELAEIINSEDCEVESWSKIAYHAIKEFLD